jgi:serine/threonine protein kinase
MEFAPGVSLSQYYKSAQNRRLPESVAKLIFRQIVDGVKYMHSLSVFHRDLKTDNIIVDRSKLVKIIDFGFSVRADSQRRLNLCCGTPNYMAPEIVLNREYWGGPADVWSLGVMLFLITTGDFPFKGSLDVTRQQRQGAQRQYSGQ